MKLDDLEKFVLDLPETDRAVLAARILDSLPASTSNEDDEVAEALRRDREMDENPEAAVSWDSIRKALGRAG